MMENQRFVPDALNRLRPTTRRNVPVVQRLACSPHTYLKISAAAGMPDQISEAAYNRITQQQAKNKSKGQRKKQPVAQDHSVLETPCRQIAQLTLQSTAKNPSKLISGKSLTQLMPKRLFFRKKSWLSSSSSSIESGQEEANQNDSAHIISTSDCPQIEADLLGDENQLENPDSSIASMTKHGKAPELLVNRVNSASLLALPRQSLASSPGSNDWSLDKANLSPIILKRARDGLSSTLVQAQLANTTTTPVSTIEEVDEQFSDDRDQSQDRDSSTKSERNKGFKKTASVLRDVKNSIGLRLRAKHESRAFAKFTNELTTPSPGAKQLQQPAVNTDKELKSKRKLSLLGNKKSKSIVKNENDLTEKVPSSLTPKGRIALQHKKHLMHANKFAFDSPTGRLRETVKEVEQFQQCIEDISKAIKSRRV